MSTFLQKQKKKKKKEEDIGETYREPTIEILTNQTEHQATLQKDGHNSEDRRKGKGKSSS